MFLDWFIGIIPMAFIILGGTLVSRFGSKEKKTRRLIYFLIVVNIVLLTLILIASRGNYPHIQLGYPPTPLLFGTIAAIFSLFIINFRYLRQTKPVEKIVLLVLFGLQTVLLIFGTENPMENIYLLLISMPLILLAWGIRNRSILPVVIVFIIAVTLAHIPLFELVIEALNPSIIKNRLITSIFSIPIILFFLIPALGIAFSSVLLLKVMDPAQDRCRILEERTDRLGQINLTRLAAAIMLIASTAYALYWHTIWDNTSDGLGGGFIFLPSAMVAICAGLVIGIIGNLRAKVAGVLLGLIIPILLSNVQEAGWASSYHAITENRAVRIQTALDDFYELEGNYPAQLSELTPKTMLIVRPPVILFGEEWCYQGQGDSYRLGAIYREYFSTPFSIREYASAGDPGDVWDCRERLPEIRTMYEAP